MFLATFSILPARRQRLLDVVRRREESFFPCNFQASQKIVKCNGGDVLFVRQHRMKFFECCVGVIGDEFANFFFVGSEFDFGTGFILFGSDAAGVSTLLEEIIDPGGTHGIFLGDFQAGQTGITVLHNSFSQIKRIGLRHRLLRE